MVQKYNLHFMNNSFEIQRTEDSRLGLSLGSKGFQKLISLLNHQLPFVICERYNGIIL